MADWLEVVLLAVLVGLTVHDRYRRDIQRLMYRLRRRRG